MPDRVQLRLVTARFHLPLSTGVLPGDQGHGGAQRGEEAGKPTRWCRRLGIQHLGSLATLPT
jgi:hypothetical protein